ncbi:MAG: hypothetical protein QXR93_05990 [Archaeoglobaceae archaeon]
MPRLRTAQVPIAKLVETNMDVQASAAIQISLLQTVQKLEKEKQNLKIQLHEILQRFEKIDKLQNEALHDVILNADRIFRVMHKSNGFLKQFDVGYGRRERNEHSRVLTLFG